MAASGGSHLKKMKAFWKKTARPGPTSFSGKEKHKTTRSKSSGWSLKGKEEEWVRGDVYSLGTT